MAIAVVSVGWHVVDGVPVPHVDPDVWIVAVPSGDSLTGDWSAAFADAVRRFPHADLVYGDHVLVDGAGDDLDPVHLPDPSPERFREQGPLVSVVAVRSSALVAATAGAPLVAGAEVYDLVLRLVERGSTIAHVRSVVARHRAGPLDLAARRAALDAHLHRQHIAAAVVADPTTAVLRIERTPARAPSVSVVIPTRGSTGRVWSTPRVFVVEAVRSLLAGTRPREFEVVVVADTSTPEAVLAELDSMGGGAVRTVMWDRPFNFSAKINRGVGASAGDVLLLLNDDTELALPGSVGAMAAYFTDPDPPYGRVGLVGADLRFEDGTLQHGGHVYCEQPLHALTGWPDGDSGPQDLLAVTRECIGVTAAAAMTDRDTFDRVGGFPEDLPLDFNDVAYSLRVHDLGRRCLWTPQARWFHFEGRTRQRGPRDDEFAYITSRWGDVFDDDPYYNPNLAPRRADWVELPPRAQRSLPASKRVAALPRHTTGH